MTDWWWLWLPAAFLCGALPFSVWIGRGWLGADIRRYGDANPGATNVMRAGGRLTAVTALLLDAAKGAAPVTLARIIGPPGHLELCLIALMPVLGHAFSPFLNWRGGKAVATTFGVWTALTVWEAPTVFGLTMAIGVWLFGANGWAVMLGFAGLLIYLLADPRIASGQSFRADSAVLIAVWLGNVLIVAWKHRLDLQRIPSLRPFGRTR